MSEFIKFCLVGVVNTTLSFGVFYVLSEILGFNYLLSSFIGYAVGIANSFVLNKRWTFGNQSKSTPGQFAGFSAVNLFSLGVNLLVIFLAVEKHGLAKTYSQALAIGFSTVVNYLGSRLVFTAKLRDATN